VKAAGQMGENERARETSFAVPSCEGEESVFRGGVCNYLFLSE